MNNEILHYRIEYLCNGIRYFHDTNLFGDISSLTEKEIEYSLIYQTKKDNEIKKTDEFEFISKIILTF